MDTLKIGRYIQHLRKNAGMTQKELAEKLSISFQAVSKWENGETLPDTGILLALCDELGTTADKLLHGGSLLGFERRLLPLEDVKEGFRCMESIGALLGEDSTFFTGMVEGRADRGHGGDRGILSEQKNGGKHPGLSAESGGRRGGMIPLSVRILGSDVPSPGVGPGSERVR